MNKKTKGKSPENKVIKSSRNPLAGIDDGLSQNYQRDSSELIYESVMRGGGAPFGAPFDVGTMSLTEKIVQYFKLKGFFGFETLERTKVRKRKNKFSLYGSSNFLGEHQRGKGVDNTASDASARPKKSK